MLFLRNLDLEFFDNVSEPEPVHNIIMHFKSDSDVESGAFFEHELVSLLDLLVILEVESDVSGLSIFADELDFVHFYLGRCIWR